MPKRISPHKAWDGIFNELEAEFDDMVEALVSRESYNQEEHPWSWYLRRDVRISEGWTLVTINPDHKNITVANWLTEQGTAFEYDSNEFLLADSKYATLVMLKYA